MSLLEVDGSPLNRINWRQMLNKVQQDKVAAIEVIRAAALKFSGTFICRDNVGSFTGGAINPRHLANLDSKGSGVPGAFKVGKKQCYPVDSLVDWLISRLKV